MLYVRLYIDKKTSKIAICETDHFEIKRPYMAFSSEDENGEESLVSPYVITCFCIEDMSDGSLPPLNAREFVEDISDDGEVNFGTSILKVKPDFTVELCNESAKTNTGNLKNCRSLKIHKCEVINHAA